MSCVRGRGLSDIKGRVTLGEKDKVPGRERVETSMAQQTQSESPLREPEPELRAVVIGWQQKGKTALVKAIMGPQYRAEKWKQEKVFNGQKLTLIDTPGIKPDQERLEVMKYMVELMDRVAPGPHIFLLVLEMKAQTGGHLNVLEVIQEMFKGSNVYTLPVVIHTNMEKEDGDEKFLQGIKLGKYEKYISSTETFGTLNIEKVDTNEVKNLLVEINELVKTNKGPYSNEELKKDLKQYLEKKEEYMNGGGNQKGWMARIFAMLPSDVVPVGKGLVALLMDVIKKIL